MHKDLCRTQQTPVLVALAVFLLAAASSLSRADEDVTFHLPFEGSLKPKTALGEKTFRSYGEMKFVRGVKGKALVVGGKSRFVYPADRNVGTTKGTCSMWVQPIDWTPSEEKFYFFVALQNVRAKQHIRVILYKVHSSGNVTLLYQNQAEGKAIALNKSVITWKKKQWRHLVFTWDEDADLRLYVDGRLSGKRKCISMPPEGWKLFVGIPWPGWIYLGEGKTAVDELTVYSRVLSDDEIRALYDGTVEESQAPGLAHATMKKTQREGNLASARSGAFVLTSSFRNSKTFYPDNLIDGDGDSVWRAWDADFPQWIELRWPYPMRVNEIAFEEIAPTVVTTYSVEAWQGDGWKLLTKSTDRPSQESGRIGCKFPEVTVERLRLVLESGKGQFTQLSEVEVFGPPQPVVSALEPYWHAWYIWYAEPDRMHKGNAPRYFRKSFTIADLAAVKSAYIQLRSNDYYKVHINGKEVASGSTDIWPISAKDYLRQGKNTVAIVADLVRSPGRFGWGELIAELALNYETRNVYVGTDRTWKSHDKLVKGWKQTDFDDGAWKESAPYVQPPKGPWGKIPYYPTSYRESVVVNKLAVTPATAKPGGKVRIDIRLTPLTQLKNDYVFVLELKGKEVIRGWCNFHLTSAVADPETPTSQWKRNQTATVSTEVYLPAYSPDGAVPISLRALDKKRGVSLNILNAEKRPVTEIGSVRIARLAEKPKFGPLPKCRVVKKNNSLVFKIGDEVITPITWMIHTPSFEKFHEYTKSGMKIFWLMNKGHIDESPKTRRRSMEHVDVQIRHLLAINPDAYIILTFDLRPAQKWLKENAAEQMISGVGKRGPVCFASKKYQELIKQNLEAYLDFLTAQPYAGRIIGYRTFSIGAPDSALGAPSGNTWQTDRRKVHLGDYNPQAVKLFQGYLREKYKNSVAALRKSWKDDAATFDTTPPAQAELTSAPADGGVFEDPTRGNKNYDYLEFMSKLLPWNYFRIAKIINDKTGGKAIVGIHYGYCVEYLRGIHPPGPKGDNDFDFKNMLENPAMQYYAGAIHYGARLAGSSFQNMFPVTSIVLHDKLYVCDADYRTVIANPVTYGRQRSMKESVAVLQRDMATMIVQGFGTWFSDMGGGRGRSEVGWFSHPKIHGTIKKMNEIYKTAITMPRRRTAEVAVFISGHTWYYHDIFGSQNIYKNLVRRVIYGELPRLGTPFDIYMMNDLKDDYVQKQYKMYVFINPYYMSEEEAGAVERLKRDGKTLFWFYAPGYVNRTTGLVAENITRTTGITVKKKPVAREEMQYSLTNTSHPITQGMNRKTVFKAVGFSYPLALKMHPVAFGPVFYVDDAQATALGAYPDGRVAVAVKDMGRWKSVYCAVPYANKHLIRGAAKYAGVHMYCEPDTVMEADNRLVMIHNGFEGKKNITIRLPEKCTVYDAWTDELIARGAKTIRTKLDDCQTKVFLLR